MNHYRLLRDNKESGPYSQEEMIAKGFKPYDLIWVEGKSAGWRYPSEIPELKVYAPVVEEQPYDRFYKKPAQQKHSRFEERVSNTSFSSTTLKKEEVIRGEWKEKEERPVIKPAYSIQPTAGRHIHVTLPSGNTVNVNTVTARKEPVEEQKKFQPMVEAEEKKSSFTENISAPYQTITTENTRILKKETAVKVLATGSNNVIKDNQVSYSYPAQPNSNFQWTTLLGLFVGIATLVGLGIMIGLSISRTKNELIPGTGIAKKTSPVITAPVNSNAGMPSVKEDKPSEQVNQISGSQSPEENKELVKNAVIKSSAAPVNAVKEEAKIADNKPLDPSGNSQSVSQSTELTRKAALVPSFDLLAKQLNLTTHGYKVGAFGGISDLQCTLVNDSKFALDMVEVEVQYIQANDKVYKTEILSFKDIAAGTQVTLNAPKSSRGIKVTGKIIKINSKESGLLNATVKS